jgi:IS605 OrfB family transposase
MFPTQKEQEKLKMMMSQFRWYYNSIIDVIYREYGKDDITKNKKYSNYTIRDLFRKYRLIETRTENVIFQDFEKDENNNSLPVPFWWDGQVHSRLPRGAINKCVYALNSAVSNYRNGNIKKFTMKDMTTKKNTEYLHFEDSQFPAFIRNIKSRYWFTTKNRKREFISFNDIDAKKRSIEILYEKDTDRYFLHYPVEVNWYPSEDKRIESQDMFTYNDNRIISLDPGVRKFLVGYDPCGTSVFIGDKASKTLSAMLLDVDTSQDKISSWRNIKNYINELHWKSISYLVRNYDIIILPEFRVSEMLKKKKLGRMTKRLLSMFSFYKFKQRLEYKCSVYNKKLIIVDESYTSKTCGNCGVLNDVGSKEEYCCSSCGVIIDRDVNGARNILIKNVGLRCS